MTSQVLLITTTHNIVHTGCMDSTRLTTIIDSFPTYSGLSGGLNCELNYYYASTLLNSCYVCS